MAKPAKATTGTNRELVCHVLTDNPSVDENFTQDRFPSSCRCCACPTPAQDAGTSIIVQRNPSCECSLPANAPLHLGPPSQGSRPAVPKPEIPRLAHRKNRSIEVCSQDEVANLQETLPLALGFLGLHKSSVMVFWVCTLGFGFWVQGPGFKALCLRFSVEGLWVY